MATPPHPNKYSSANHTNPHTSLLLCEALSHTLSLLTLFAATSAPFLKECINTLHMSIHGSLVKGCLRERRKCFLTHKFPLPLPSLSLVSFTLTLSLSLFHFAFSSLLLFTLSQCTQRPSMKEELTSCKRKSDITCTHDERENKMNE